jgi:hypothetical protein
VISGGVVVLQGEAVPAAAKVLDGNDTIVGGAAAPTSSPTPTARQG